LVTFYLKGRPVTAKLGRVGEMPLQEARTLTVECRAKAQKGIDPRPLLKRQRRGKVNRQEAEAEQAAASGNLYRHVVADFIELYAKPRQRSWDATQRILLKNCAAWLDLDITSIAKKDALALLDRLVAEGHGPKAKVTLAWLRKLWRWCWERDVVSVPLMDAVKVDFAKRTRSRVYNDAEITAIWKAADQLSAIDGSYIKLLLLLAPRKTALALMRRSDLDNVEAPMLWTTPFEYTKSRKTTSKPKPYKTPLPPLAQRILKPLLKGEGDRIFPSLSVRSTQSEREWFDGNRLVRHLGKHGAPADFNFHACRHTLATWLQTKGHSEWECGLVLNHAGSGSVTAGYSHGYPVELKLKLLTEWAEHVENLLQPTGVALLR
jgi:integrase